MEFDYREGKFKIVRANVPVKILNKSTNVIPSYQTEGASGLDIAAWIHHPKQQSKYREDAVIIDPGKFETIYTGLYFGLPSGYEFQVRPRSGLARRNGITLVNAPGTIDSDFLGELCIILINHGHESLIVRNGDRIAQIILCEVPKVVWNEVCSEEELGSTQRGTAGFGSTGLT